MLIDIHTHTTFSSDGRVSAEDLVRTAIERKVDILGTCEHIDFDYDCEGLEVKHTDIDAYVSTCNVLKQKYAGQIELLTGAEFAYHANAGERYAAALEKYGFDYVINSTHLTDGLDCYLQPYFAGKEKSIAYRRYLETVYESLEPGYDYHIVGHLGYAARNAPYPDPRMRYADFPELFDRILEKVISLEKVLEVNTNVKTAGAFTLASEDALSRYFELGGRLISYGSDAHESARLLDGHTETLAMLRRIGFSELCFFRKGEMFRYAL